jgi:hypothetical protein
MLDAYRDNVTVLNNRKPNDQQKYTVFTKPSNGLKQENMERNFNYIVLYSYF